MELASSPLQRNAAGDGAGDASNGAEAVLGWQVCHA